MHEIFNKNLIKAPLTLRFYTVIIFLLLAVFLLILTQGRYGKQEMVRGLIRNESFFRVSANKPGNVSELYVAEGDSVKKGAPLFRLILPFQDVTDNDSGESMMQQSVKRLLETRRELQNEELLLTAEINDQEEHQANYLVSVENSMQNLLKTQQDLQKKKTNLNKQLKDYQKLLKDKSINKAEIESLRHYITDNDIALNKAANEIEGLTQNKNEKSAYYTRILRELQQTHNDILRKKREVSSELNRLQMQHDYVVTAPVDGIIHDVGILKGDYVEANFPSLIVREDDGTEPVVILYLSSSQIGLIDPDERVFLRVDTFPYESYGVLAAKVMNVSQTPIKISLDDKESRFRVRLKIDTTYEHNRIPLAMLNDGMSVTASLRQPRQTLIEWLFLPVKKSFERNPDVRI